MQTFTIRTSFLVDYSDTEYRSFRKLSKKRHNYTGIKTLKASCHQVSISVYIDAERKTTESCCLFTLHNQQKTSEFYVFRVLSVLCETAANLLLSCNTSTRCSVPVRIF